MAGGSGLAYIISGLIRGDPVAISVFTITNVLILIVIIHYTSYFKKRFPKMHEYINKVLSNK